MDATHSKSVFVYRQVRRALRSGHYAPGQRIDPARLAAEFNTSPTPVRFALYRLVGETLLVDHARDGLHVPLLNEVAMRDLYDWMEHLLLTACDIDAARVARKAEQLELASADDDLVKLTWLLFDAIAAATAHGSLHHAVKQAKLILAAQQWLAAHPQHAKLVCRFDVVSYDGPPEIVRREWLCGAFESN
jgi:DNA-binding GntR family transcriptional regulator